MGKRSKDDERQIKRWKGIVNRFKGKLIEVITKAGSKFNDYSVSPKITQILLHWDYELTEYDLWDYFFISIKHELLLV